MVQQLVLVVDHIVQANRQSHVKEQKPILVTLRHRRLTRKS